ncbi:MAG: HAMP domain-containing histidine kinase, partial [Bacteroidales bacterium]|nr:HAMP domain-containing histidine kinase [Bacteroidales bacterium]
GKQMLNMVMNILDTQKYQDTTMVVDLTEHQLNDILQPAMEQVQFLCEQKNVSLTNNITSDYTVMVDFESIRRVFVNLFTNALKFTPINGEILVNADEQEENGLVKISVQDNGAGIPKDKLQVVFDKFVQVQTKDSGVIKSTGLGLSFCKLAIEAHGWEIGVDSELGKGATFWFTIQPIGKLSSQANKKSETNSDDTLPCLSGKDAALVTEIINDLRTTRIYQISKLRKILSKVENSENENVTKWKDAVEQAIRTENEEIYGLLLNTK